MNEQYAYLGSFTSLGGRGVTVARVDPGTGALHDTGHDTPLADPSFLALTPDREALCAVRESEEGAVTVLGVRDPSRPVPTRPPLPVGGAAPTHLAVTATRVYTANYTSGTVSALALRDGLLQGPAQVSSHTGSGPVIERQRGPHAHGVLVARGGWLLAADLGTDSVWVHRTEAGEETGPDAPPALRVHGETPLPAGSGPRHLAFHPDGRTVYVVHELEPLLTRCRWQAESGSLRVEAETALLPPGLSGQSFASGLAVRADGRRLYVANRGHDSISVFRLDPADGAAQLLTTVACGGSWPRDLTLAPDGRRLYVALERSDEVAWFDIDHQGVPRRGGALPLPAPTCVVLR